MPVKFLIFPARARAYNPLGSRCSQTSIGALRNISRKLSLRRDAAGHLPFRMIGGNERRYANEPSLCEEPRHLAGAADIFLAVLRRKTEVSAQATAKIVTVEHPNVLLLL